MDPLRVAPPRLQDLAAPSGRPVAPAVPAPPPDPADATRMSPWARLEGNGWYAQAQGTLAAVLEPSLQVALAQGLERMAQAGVTFQKPSFFGLRRVECTARQAFDHAMERPPEALGLVARLPEGAEVPIANLKDLMAVDLVEAGGEASRSTTAEARAFLNLEKDGWTFLEAGEGSHPISTLEAFRLSGEEPASVHLQGPQGQSRRLFSRRDIVAVNFFLGDGQDFGLANPAVAAGLKDLAARGLEVGILSGGWYTQEPDELYQGSFRMVADGSLLWMARRSDVPEGYQSPFDEGHPAMPVVSSSLHALAPHPDRLEAQLQAFQEAATRHVSGLQPVVLQCGLQVMGRFSQDLPWEALLGGYARFLAVAPGFTAPIDLARGYGALLEGCPSGEELDHRLSFLEKTPRTESGDCFREHVAEAARQSLADRRELEAMAQALDGPGPTGRDPVAVTEREVRIGGLVLPRRERPAG